MKLKNNSSAKKRFRKTGSGKFMQQKAARNHLLTNKTKRQKKLSPKGALLDKSHQRQVERMLPNF